MLKEIRFKFFAAFLGLTGAIVLTLGAYFLFEKFYPVLTGQNRSHQFQILGEGHFQESLKVGNKTLYDYTYFLHSNKRLRHYPSLNIKTQSQFVALLGGSWVWGEGLNEEETLPVLLSSKLKDQSVLGLGMRGAGPGEAYFYLGQGHWDSLLPQNQIQGTFVYLLINAHLNRVIPELTALSYWPERPVFTLLDNGKASYAGPAQTVHPWWTWLGQKIGSSHFVTSLKIGRSLQSEKMKMACALFRSLEGEIKKRGSQFVVAIAPYQNEVTPLIGECFQRFQLDYLELGKGMDETRYLQLVFPIDGHPTLELNELMAKELANAL